MVLAWEIALACIGGAAFTITILILVCWVRRKRHPSASKEPLLPPGNGKEQHSPSSKTPPVLKGSQPIEFIVPKTIESPVLVPGTPVQMGSSIDKELMFPALARLQERRRSSFAAPVNIDELDLSLYGEGAGTNEDIRGLTSVRARGRLCFTVTYDSDHGYLIVNVLRALHLLSSFGTKLPDTYVHLSLRPLPENGQEKGQREKLPSDTDGEGERPPACTAVVKGSDSPQFDQSFCLPLEGQSGATTCLVLTMAEYDRFSHRTRMGRVYFPLADLATYLEFQGLPEVWRDLLPEDEELQSRGQVLVSLNRQRNALQIGLLELKDISPKGLPEPKWDAAYLYVRLTLVIRDAMAKRRRSRLVHFGACAVINEEFSLDIKEDELDEMALTLAVCCRDAGGRSVVIGKACMGALMFVTGSSLQHWKDAMGVRNRLVEHWHTLY